MKVDVNVMKHVAFTDLVRVHVIEDRPGHVSVEFECLEKGMQVEFDTGSLKELNARINEKIQSFAHSDIPNAKIKEYVSEFVTRMAEALHKNGLVEINPIPDAADDPYADLRNLHK